MIIIILYRIVETIIINDKVTVLQKEIWYFILMYTQYRI